jgi:DNA-binding PadR family transcriptional regulator
MIKYALLGLLREQSDYGYRLKQRFDERVGTVWHLNIGQVYQTLRALDRTGLIVPRGAAGDDHQPSRRRFDLTTKGERALERWLQRPLTQPRPLRDEILIRLLILRPSRRDEALLRITQQEHLYKRHLTGLLKHKRRLLTQSRLDVELALLGVEAALLHTEAHLKWLDYCRQQVGDALQSVTGTR